MRELMFRWDETSGTEPLLTAAEGCEGKLTVGLTNQGTSVVQVIAYGLKEDSNEYRYNLKPLESVIITAVSIFMEASNGQPVTIRAVF